jgi:hypothetical protein
MTGYITAEMIDALPNLKHLNLAHNKLFGELPNVEGWANMKNLSII